MRILITAGPTWEPIDAVRYIGNRASGKLGIALAQAASDQGHNVTLLLGPGCPPPGGVDVVRFESARQLENLLQEHFANHDVLVMSAAVADYRPRQYIEGKRPRGRAGDTWSLELEPIPDLVAAVAHGKTPAQRVIAFALDPPATLHNRAADKLKHKQVDAIVANPLGTIGADDIDPLWLTATGDSESPGKMSKTDFARWLIQKVEQLFDIE